MSSLYGRPTAAELVAAVADFLDSDVRESTEGQVSFHARVAANVLRTVERELTDDRATPDMLGYDDEEHLAAAIRAGDLDGRAAEVLPCLRTLVRHRLAVAHPGYDETNERRGHIGRITDDARRVCGFVRDALRSCT